MSTPPFFEVTHRDSATRARRGILHTPHGEVETPVFAPVGTQASVKTLLSQDLEKLGIQLILANTYHLYLRPGLDVIERAGGLHRFMQWDRAILTDSGGFQVFSLESLRKITDEGVEFQSHLDGSKHFFSPERAIQIQRVLGSDVVMCFDECAPYPCTEAHARAALERTTRWAKRCRTAFEPVVQDAAGPSRVLYGITQGSVFAPLRQESARQLVDLDFPGYAIGGLSVGEPQAAMHEMIGLTTEILPLDKPRYLMGVGTPEDLWEAVALGIDQFDCVLPTRNGRNGQLFTPDGKLNIRNSPYRLDFAPVDGECDCDLCSHYSRAYLHHLFRAGELSALRLASLHNVAFLIRLTRQIRQSIVDGNFAEARARFLARYQRPKE